jgi:hypothetical protein
MSLLVRRRNQLALSSLEKKISTFEEEKDFHLPQFAFGYRNLG